MNSLLPNQPADSRLSAVWLRFWLCPADSRPLDLVRMLTAGLALMLWWSYANDLQTWFGPQGVLPSETVSQWRSPLGLSLFDCATTAAALQALFWALGVVFGLLLLGLCTPLVAVLAALLWASLLHRGPMLVGPADDCLAVLLWCVAIGPAGQHFSLDRLLANRAGKPAATRLTRTRIALGLLQVHASAITIAALLAQLKADVWWDGSAAWWLTARGDSRLIDLSSWLAQSTYLMNALTHSITAFEILFAIGIWLTPTQRPLALTGLIAWPLIGVLAGEPLWGLIMATFAVPFAFPLANLERR